MIIGNTNKFSMPLPDAVTSRSQRIGGAEKAPAAANDRRGASPGRGGEQGGGVRATAAPFDQADASFTNPAQAMTGHPSAAVEALLFALIGQHMQARLSA